MTAESLGVVATRVHGGSWTLIHASPDRPHERTNMGVGHMGWYGSTLCGLKGSPWDGHPFMRPVNGSTGLTFAEFLTGSDEGRPCPKCRAAFNRSKRTDGVA